MAILIRDKFLAYQRECEERFSTLKQNEEELNRIFIEIYGLQDELTPEVEDKDVTVRRADEGREIRSLLSYSVGCMFGRYSLDVKGLVYAGGEWDAGKYKSFLPCKDNVLVIPDEADYLEDDIVARFVEFIRIVYGEETVADNLRYISEVLGTSGNTSREKIRNYFLKDFYSNHVRIYQKRPIYWLFDSGRENSFKALIYLHRYTADTVGKVRADYLLKLQASYKNQLEAAKKIIEEQGGNERNQAKKRESKLVKQLNEIKDYDTKLYHIATERIELDLDDGVKVNYEKLQTDRNGKKYEILGRF